MGYLEIISLKWEIILEPNAEGGPRPGEERYSNRKQSPAARAEQTVAFLYRLSAVLSSSSSPQL